MRQYNNIEFDRTETKAVRVKDGQGTAHTVKIELFDAEDSVALGDAGFGGENKQYTICDGGMLDSHYDAYKLARQSQMMTMNETAEEFIKGVHTGEILWEQVIHDDVLFPQDVEELRNGSGR